VFLGGGVKALDKGVNALGRDQRCTADLHSFQTAFFDQLVQLGLFYAQGRHGLFWPKESLVIGHVFLLAACAAGRRFAGRGLVVRKARSNDAARMVTPRQWASAVNFGLFGGEHATALRGAVAPRSAGIGAVSLRLIPKYQRRKNASI
jgi:hypothetical protein